MFFGFLTLITALTIAGVAAWFSIAGLMAIFSAAAMPIAVMAGTLEVGKLLTASWLYRYWHTTSFALKSYLSIAVVVLMMITSMGIFGYLSKAHLDQAGVSGDAVAAVERIDNQISREENKITTLQDRIASIGGNSTFNVSDSIQQQESIRDGAWTQVQGDIDYNQQQITSVRNQLTADLAALDSREEKLDARLSQLDSAVSELRNKGVEVIETDAGGVFRNAETETIDYVAQAAELRESQQIERGEIAQQKSDLDQQRQQLRAQSTADIKTFQDAINRYREQAQSTIDSANQEINRLRNQSAQSQDDTLEQIDNYNNQIDEIYKKIADLKDERFVADSAVRELEKEVGPIKYVAQLLFGGDGAELLDKAVQVFILMLVFVFDPLAVMLVIAANQTLLRYGINLEKAGPDDDGSNPSNSNNTNPVPDPQSGEAADQGNSEDIAQSGDQGNDHLHIQQPGHSGEHDSEGQSNQPADVNDVADKDKEIAELKEQLNKKPKEVIKEVEKIVEVEKDSNFELKTPKAIQQLEKKLQEKLNGK